MMILLFFLVALSLFALFLSWSKQSARKNLALISLLSLFALGLYFPLGYMQGYALKDWLVKMDTTPMAVNYDEVHQLLSQHLYWHSDDALAHAFQGRLHFASQDYPAAAASFSKAYALMPNDGDLQLEYATALYLSGDRSETLAQLAQALKSQEPIPYSAHSLLANMAMDEGKPAIARTHWEALLSHLPPDSEEAKNIRLILTEL